MITYDSRTRYAGWAAVAVTALMTNCSSAGDGAGPASGESDSAPPPTGDANSSTQNNSSAGGSDSGAGKPARVADASGGSAKDARATDGTTGTGIVDGGADSSTPPDAQPDDGGVPTPPQLLSATGLFKSIAANGTLVLGDGVQPYQPKYVLWADTDSKNRWIYVPPGTKIDTSDMDHWSFPAGTKFWKEFEVNGKRVETRLLWKYGPGADDVLYYTYWWNPEAGIADDAELTDPDNGAQAVNGTMHDIPAQQDCKKCHDSLEEHVLGFGAIQLNHTLAGANIHSLISAGTLTNNPNVADLAIPGDSTAQAALGYLHANCGNCHNDTPGATGVPDPKLNLRVLVRTKTVQSSLAYTTGVNQPTTDFTSIPYRIAGQDLAKSCVIHDMTVRGAREQMPPLASKEVDDAGVAAVSAWIMTLPKAP